MRIEFAKPKLKDVRQVYQNMRDADVRELQAGADNSPRKALLQGVRMSDVVQCAYIDGEAVAILGTAGNCIWLLSTESIKKAARYIVNCARSFIAEALKYYDFLYNFIYAKNKIVLKLLKRIGFVICAPTRHELSGELFHMAYVTKHTLKGAQYV